jgi:hypothetical protein
VAVKEFLKSIHTAMNKLALVAVITVFCGIFVFPLFYNRKDAKTAKSELAEIGGALQKFHAESGEWPSSGGRAVAAALGGAKAFSKHERKDSEGRFLDPWETPYRFYFSKDGFTVRSAGQDKKFAKGLSSGEDDYWFSP